MSTSAERMRRLRERRAAEIEAGEPRERAEDDLLAPAVARTLAALDLGPEDASAAGLALQYARTIDAAAVPASALRWLGPELLKVLESLGGSPAARARMRKPGPEKPREPSRLGQLRAERAAGRGPGAA